MNIWREGMKKSEIDVTMPMTTFEELNSYVEKYNQFLNDFKDCFDLTNADYEVIYVDFEKIVSLARRKMPLKFIEHDYDIR